MTEYTLAIEGSTYAGSIALLHGQAVVAERTLADTGTPSRDGRDENVLPSVADCLEAADVRVDQIARVVCGAGPGSFTSLRIAASVAKGIAVGVGCPMFAVSSLLLSAAVSASNLAPGMYLSVLPAMREEWFAMLIEGDRAGTIHSRGDVTILAGSELSRAAGLDGAMVLGPGQEIDSRPHALGVAVLLDQIIAAGPIAIDTWEPDYGRLAEAQVRWEAAHGKALEVNA